MVSDLEAELRAACAAGQQREAAARGLEAYGPEIVSYLHAFHLAAIAVGQLHYGRRYCTGFALSNLGEALEALGDLPAALAVTRAAHELFTLYRGVDVPHPDVALTSLRLGQLHAAMKQPELALPYLERSQAIYARTLGADHLHAAGGLAAMGQVLAELGRCPEALAPLEKAVAIWERGAPENPEVGYPLTTLGRCLVQLGRGDEARRILERALAIREAAGIDAAETRAHLGRLRRPR